MIRVYVALFVALLVGLGLSQQSGPAEFIGEVLAVLAAVGIHAHYTQE
jgi:hypothetical protein